MTPFKFGSKVTSIKTNNGESTGIVVGIIVGGDWEGATMRKYHEWDNDFPDWQTKPIYVIRLNTPRRNLSLAEFIKHGGIEENYNLLPFHTHVMVVHDDLEEVEFNFYNRFSFSEN